MSILILPYVYFSVQGRWGAELTATHQNRIVIHGRGELQLMNGTLRKQKFFFVHIRFNNGIFLILLAVFL